MERGKIVRNVNSDVKGITLNSNCGMTEVLHYDFSVTAEITDDLIVIGTSDTIYKCMYEMNMAE